MRMATAGERNKVIKLLDMKGYDPTLTKNLHISLRR